MNYACQLLTPATPALGEQKGLISFATASCSTLAIAFADVDDILQSTKDKYFDMV